MKKFSALPIALAALAFAVSAHGEVVVVVNPRNTVNAITSEQVGQIYMGASTTFPGGATANPLDQPEGSPLREEFLAKVLDKSPQQVKAVWSRLIFSGKGTRPRTLANSADVKKAVAADPAAIGFMERSAADDSVKVVLSVK